MANPPFNVDKVDKERIKDDPRFPFGMPRADNANYLWIQLFYSRAERDGAGRVRHGELGRRRPRLRAGDPPAAAREPGGGRDGLDRPELLLHGDAALHALVLRPGQGGDAARRDKVLFIDARHIFRQMDRAHREFTPEQIEFLANIVRLYRGEEPETRRACGSRGLTDGASSRRGSTPTCPDCARWRRWTRSRRRAGA